MVSCSSTDITLRLLFVLNGCRWPSSSGAGVGSCLPLFRNIFDKMLGICYFGSRVSFLVPYLYLLTTYPRYCKVSTWRIMWLTPYSCSTGISSFVASFASLTALRRCWVSCFGRFICVVSCGLSVTCSHVGDSVRKPMETVFYIPRSLIVTQFGGTLSTLYSPDVQHNNLVYRRLTISSAGIWRNSGYFGTVYKYVDSYPKYRLPPHILIKVAVVESLDRAQSAWDCGIHQLSPLWNLIWHMGSSHVSRYVVCRARPFIKRGCRWRLARNITLKGIFLELYASACSMHRSYALRTHGNPSDA